MISPVGGDEELWADLERADLADFMRSMFKDRPIVDLQFPEYLHFSSEQRAFISSLVAHVVQDLTHELSHKWTTHMIHALTAGEWQEPDGARAVAEPEHGDAPIWDPPA